MRYLTPFCLSLLLLIGLSACGQKGPLVLPSEADSDSVYETQ